MAVSEGGMGTAIVITQAQYSASELRGLAVKCGDAAVARRLLAIGMILDGGSRHANGYIFGAICPARGVGAALILPTFDAERMSLHLAEIGAQVAVAALICDDAGWRQTGGAQLPDNVVLVPLPSYAPELNPMENVWQFLRANKLCATVWDSYDDILDACAEAWNGFVADVDRIKSIGTRDWATVNVQGGWYKASPEADDSGLQTKHPGEHRQDGVDRSQMSTPAPTGMPIMSVGRRSEVRQLEAGYFPRWAPKKEAISPKASLLSGRVSSNSYCACDCPS